MLESSAMGSSDVGQKKTQKTKNNPHTHNFFFGAGYKYASFWMVNGISDLEYMPKETAGDEGLGIKDVIMQLSCKAGSLQRRVLISL